LSPISATSKFGGEYLRNE